MKTYAISVICPCFNESANIPALVDRLEKVFSKKKIDGEIVLVDDASMDSTKAVIRAQQEIYPNIRLVSHPKNRGIAVAWKSGTDAAAGIYVCFMDADLQNLPEDVWRLYREITFTNADVVSGWRNHLRASGDSRLRVVASRALNSLLNFLFRMRLKDNKSGFVIARKATMERILQHRFNYRHFQTFITVSANARNYTVRQIETLFDERRAGTSYLAGVSFAKESYNTLVDITKALFEFRFLRNDDRSLRNFLNEESIDIPKEKRKERSLARRALLAAYKMTFPLHHWMLTSNSMEYWDDFSRSEWMTPAQVRKYQERRLRQVINHAYHHVHYYREIFDERGLQPQDIRTIDDLAKLPVIDKPIVRENLFLGLMSNTHDKRKLQKATTSGSTGEPFYTFLEKNQIEMRWAATQRAMEWTGYSFGDRQLRLWHKYLGLSWKQVVREVIDATMTRRAFIPAYEMDEKGLELFMQTISKAKPAIIDGYAESFNFIASYLKKKKYEGHKPGAIMCSAQMLPDESRKIIEETFGCKVYDKYGAREFGGGLAYDCSEGKGHHVVAECAIIEIVKDGKSAKPGEMGEVLITDLHNFAVPLIRYRLGDFAVAMDPNDVCPCGRGLPRIGNIEGRIQSMILGENGTFLPGSFFARLFADYEHAIRQFQVVQEKPDQITINIVKAPQFQESLLVPIFKHIREHLGAKMQIDVKYVDGVALGRTGKRQHSLSRISVSDILEHVQDKK